MITTEAQVLFSPWDIEERVLDIAENLNSIYEDNADDVLFCPILQGAVPFFADICKGITFAPAVDYVGLSSYKGTEQQKEFSVYKVFVLDLIKGKTVWLFDDIADSGKTLEFLKKLALSMGAKEVKTCVLLKKKSCPFEVDFYGFEVEDDQWVWGYGMDLDNSVGRTESAIFSVIK
jgi:hypoxanthine phosphoribosyltransferase